MAFGSQIGAGFFLGSGIAIRSAGPALLAAYLIAGSLLYLIMRALGELCAAHPARGSFATYATQFIGPFAGFSVGWSFWLGIQIVGVAEVAGLGQLCHGFAPGVPQWIFALCAVCLIYAINISGVRSFGELEYWISMIKIVTIAAFVITGLAILIFKFGALGRQAGITNLWTHGGFLPADPAGVLAALPVVLFAFGGVEVVTLAAAETEDPRTSLPRAINGVFLRIILLYVGALGVVMMLLPWNRIDPQQSPFVRILSAAGLPSAAALIMLVAITALLSAGNTVLFAASRMLQGLATTGQAPLALIRINRRGVPALAVHVSCGLLLLGVIADFMVPDKIFGYALSIVAWLILGGWIVILITHLCYLRARSISGIPRPWYRQPGAPLTDWILLAVLGWFAFAFVTHGSTQTTLYLLTGWVILLSVTYWFFVRNTGEISRRAEADIQDYIVRFCPAVRIIELLGSPTNKHICGNPGVFLCRSPSPSPQPAGWM